MFLWIFLAFDAFGFQDFLETKTRDRHFAAGGAAEGQELDPRIRRDQVSMRFSRNAAHAMRQQSSNEIKSPDNPMLGWERCEVHRTVPGWTAAGLGGVQQGAGGRDASRLRGARAFGLVSHCEEMAAKAGHTPDLSNQHSSPSPLWQSGLSGVRDVSRTQPQM